MKRTTIFLPTDLLYALRKRSNSSGVRVAELIRRALLKVYFPEIPAPSPAIDVSEVVLVEEQDLVIEKTEKVWVPTGSFADTCKKITSQAIKVSEETAELESAIHTVRKKLFEQVDEIDSLLDSLKSVKK